MRNVRLNIFIIYLDMCTSFNYCSFGESYLDIKKRIIRNYAYDFVTHKVNCDLVAYQVFISALVEEDVVDLVVN